MGNKQFRRATDYFLTLATSDTRPSKLLGSGFEKASAPAHAPYLRPAGNLFQTFSTTYIPVSALLRSNSCFHAVVSSRDIRPPWMAEVSKMQE